MRIQEVKNSITNLLSNQNKNYEGKHPIRKF